MQKVKEAIFSITNRCNLSCRMCDIPENRVEELSTQRWKEIIRDASLIGAQTAVFSGGEPLLREDIFELISCARNNRMNACLTSNGCLIDENVAEKLARSGVNVVNVSIEGNESVHDFLRGNGVFKKALCGLSALKKCNIESTIASTVSNYNFEHLSEIPELALKYGVTTVRFQPFSRIFLNDYSKGNEFLIGKQDLEKAKAVMEQVISKLKENNIATNPEGYLRKIPYYLCGQGNPGYSGCGALWSTCSINSKGEILPCWVINSEDKIIGTLESAGLYELWFSERRDRVINSVIKEGCPGCMMSCYDEAFNDDSWQVKFIKKAKRADRLFSGKRLANRLVQSLRGELTKIKLRYKFYKSYRGSLIKVIKRMLNNLRSKIRICHIDSNDEIKKVAKEIIVAKNRLRREISKLK
ncbi:MAG: radical SAM protein [Candidatus Omnitrophica bacterium]|nr:radical SAM protein [Candidatus Omnitrophota bacterium]MBU1868871.1 radical SAM protein [Candidatus Omnitrophota bacterium]